MTTDDRYEWPLWEQIKHCMRMLDTALIECKQRGAAMVKAEADYYTEKANAAFALKEARNPVTFIQTVIKGVPSVTKAMSVYHAAEVEYENAREARNVWKKKLDTLREQYQREWSNPNEG